ncbi:hypothetical protein TNCV_4742821 [Trichonephila clavipes]|nr:hypothetical protein TNCV_4742821 [Trichonephila clavipes]
MRFYFNVRLFRGAVGDKFVFMDDNATCHRTLAVQDCLDSEGIQRINTLFSALTEEWDKLPQQLLDNVVKAWYDVWNVASHSTLDISRTDTFL